MDAEERARLAALRSYKILDTEPESAFDDLALLASQVCETPIALISLVDADRQWFKSRIGTSMTETPREIAFCAHAIKHRETFIVPDATADERFRDNPLVAGEAGIRFYTGAPLITADGHAIGTLCVIDRRPRTLTVEQQEALEALRRQVVAQLELRRNLDELERALAERDRAEAELVAASERVRKLSGLIPASSACRLNIVIPADPDRISAVTDGVMQIVREKRGADGSEIEVEIAVREALANAIRHGCGNDRSKSVQCCVAVEEDGELLIVVRDPGPGFDPAAVANPLSGSGLLKESGRGVFFINQFMDDVRYEDGGRELQMRKRGRGPGAQVHS